jgi:hypothetical protein
LRQADAKAGGTWLGVHHRTVEGIRTGAADADGDGYITLDEAYSYAFDLVQL